MQAPPTSKTFRAWFLRLSDPEVFVSETEVDALLAAVQLPAWSGTSLPARLDRLRGWAVERESAYAKFLSPRQDPAHSGRFARTLALQSAPLGLWLGCWLQGMIAPGVCEDDQQLLLLTQYANDLGVGLPHASRRSEFLRLLEFLRLPVQNAHADHLARMTDLDDGMFMLPVLLQALSRRSDAYHAEICAADLVLRTVGLLPGWAALRSSLPGSVRWERLDLASGTPLELRAKVTNHYVCRTTEAGTRFLSAVARFGRALMDWDERLLVLAHGAADLSGAMARLVQRRSREATVYHKETLLENCPLSRHFAAAADDPHPVVAALARSRFVRPGDSAHSPLVNALVAPRGPMFRVFPQEELDTIGDWIDSLAADPPPGVAGAGSIPAFLSPPAALPQETNEAQRPPATLREAYFLLQGRALPPVLRAFALDYVAQRVSTARPAADAARSLPAQWAVTGLRRWLLEQHDLHGRTYAELERNRTAHSREEVIRSTLQLAPLLLIDGAWLQGFTDLRLACSPAGQLLFHTFWDELGNGSPSLNHPKIYRALLASMEIALPPTGSWEFASDPRLDDSSFKLPVYWLCLGKLPRTFGPEILGMNLAMELSGVGDGYREASRFLRDHGFDTQFVDLHNTIDNVGTGHSAWAADAIDLHMSEILHRGGEEAAQREWRRVQAGYASLAPVRDSALARALSRVSHILRPTPQRSASPPPALHHCAYMLETET